MTPFIHYWTNHLAPRMGCGIRVTMITDGSTEWQFVTCKRCLAKKPSDLTANNK